MISFTDGPYRFQQRYNDSAGAVVNVFVNGTDRDRRLRRAFLIYVHARIIHARVDRGRDRSVSNALIRDV